MARWSLVWIQAEHNRTLPESSDEVDLMAGQAKEPMFEMLKLIEAGFLNVI